MVIFELSSLVDDRLNITREKQPQQMELDFFTSIEKISWDSKFILHKRLP